MIYGLGERLCEQRKLRHLTQAEVAARIDCAPSLVSNYETGERTPSLESLLALANIYNCSTDYLLGYDRKTFRIRNEDNSYYLDASMLSKQQRMIAQDLLDSLRDTSLRSGQSRAAIG